MNEFRVESYEIYKALQKHFPYAVDFQIVPMRAIIETSTELGTDSSGISLPTSVINNLFLQEIEPETGIYAAMSPFTHNVYVYMTPFIQEFYGL